MDSNYESENRSSLTEDISLTFYLVVSRKSKRLKKTMWVESIFYDILNDKNVIISDLVNYLVEKYFIEMNLLNVREHLK